jgi:hypothetical protein
MVAKHDKGIVDLEVIDAIMAGIRKSQNKICHNTVEWRSVLNLLHDNWFKQQ